MMKMNGLGPPPPRTGRQNKHMYKAGISTLRLRGSSHVLVSSFLGLYLSREGKITGEGGSSMRQLRRESVSKHSIALLQSDPMLSS